MAVDIAEQFVDLAARNRDLEHVARQISDAAPAIDLVFLHTDGGNEPDRARRERIDPVVGEIHVDRFLPLVPVVPVRETEAWLLADPEGIQRAFGTTRSIEELGLPANPGEVEHVTDPKALLATAYQRTVGPGRRRRRAARGYQGFFALLGEQVALARLADVPAFRRFESDLISALRQLLPYAFN